MRRGFIPGQKTTLGIAIGALVIGYVLGQAGPFDRASAVAALQRDGQGTPADPGSGTTGEVAELQTRVAELSTAAVCTPAPTATATPVPSPTATSTPLPPAAAGEPVPYGEDWTVTVTALYLTPTIGTETAEGIFALVAMTITNDGLRERNFGFPELRIRDSAGREFRPAAVYTGTAWTQRFAPGIPLEVTIAFDVAADTGEWFILESRTDPAFRVQVAPSRLG